MPAFSSRLMGSALAAVLGSVLAAQRPVFTVGGVAPDFSSLPAAVAGVPPGSILVVRPGLHEGFTTSKPLRVVLDFGGAAGAVQAPAGAPYAISVTNLPPGDEFVLLGRDATILGGAVGGLRFVDCVAPVVVESVYGVADPGGLGVSIDNCAAVHLRRSVFSGIVGIDAQFADVAISECVVQASAGPGAVFASSRCESARTFFTGWSQPGVRLLQSTARFASDGSAAIGVAGAIAPVAAIEAVDSQLQFDPATLSLLPANGAPGLLRVGGVHFVDDVPTLTTSLAAPGTTATVTLRSNTPRLGVIFFGGLLPTPFPFGVASIFVDLGPSPIVIALSLATPAGITVPATIPTSTALHGATWCLQGGVQGANGDALLSGPGLWIAL